MCPEDTLHQDFSETLKKKKFSEPQEAGGISPLFQMMKLRPRELKAFAQGQAAGK